jgi:hypothetical protein
MSRGPEPAGRSGIGSSNSRFQPRSVTGLDRGEIDSRVAGAGAEVR